MNIFHSPFPIFIVRKCVPMLATVLGALWLVACGPGGGADPAFTAKGKVTEAPVHHASGLRIQKLNDGFRVEVRNPQDTSEVIGKYRFARRNSRAAEGETVVKIPVTNMALNSTTFVPYFEKLDAHELIGGVTYTDRITNARVKRLVEEGKTLEIAGGDGINMERLLMVDPDALMAYRYGSSDFSNIEAQGIPVVMNMEYMETTPLGRAEWVKLIGCLLDRYDEAEALFDGIETEYLRLSELARSADYYPVVFSGSKYESKWFTPGNKSFVAQFIRDSGARYAFNHIEGQGNVELDFESVLSKLVKADYWGLIVSSQEEFALSNLLQMEPRYALFNSFKDGQVFVCNTAKSDYFGDAVLEPEVVLADLIAVIHPDLLPDHGHTYFRPVVIDVKS